MKQNERKKEIDRLSSILKSTQEQKDILVKELQNNCKHKKVEEMCNSYTDDWDRTTTQHYHRRCISCGLMDSSTVYSYDYGDRDPPQFVKLFDYGRTIIKVNKFTEVI